MNRVLLIDKPAGWTSFDVVAKIRGALRQRDGQKIKVGHSGTLDPFATGLLIILIGKETKNQDHYMKLDKEYEARLILGSTSTTGDPEGEIKKREGIEEPTFKELQDVLTRFKGEIFQIPPAFSAIKINGRRAYQLARQGEQVELKARKIKINKIEILEYRWPELYLRINCSSGTYIRTLAEDIGKGLETGAYLTTLRRTKVGQYSLVDSQRLEDTLVDLKSTE